MHSSENAADLDAESGPATAPSKPYICCVTAYSEASFLHRAFAAGVDSFLTKPVC